MYMHASIYIYIYIYRERERERERDIDKHIYICMYVYNIYIYIQTHIWVLIGGRCASRLIEVDSYSLYAYFLLSLRSRVYSVTPMTPRTPLASVRNDVCRASMSTSSTLLTACEVVWSV